MGIKMLDIYESVSKEKGIAGKMRLAIITGISSLKAETEPDTPENLQKFADGYKEITGKECPVK